MQGWLFPTITNCLEWYDQFEWRHTYVWHISSMREDLHWLPMHKCIDFEILILMRNCLADCVLHFISENYVSWCHSNFLAMDLCHRAAQGSLIVFPARACMVQHRSLAVVGPTFWIRLPKTVQHNLIDFSLPLFLTHLKAVLFDPGCISVVRSRVCLCEYHLKRCYVNLCLWLQLHCGRQGNMWIGMVCLLSCGFVFIIL